MKKKFSEMSPAELKKRRIRHSAAIAILWLVIHIIGGKHIVAAVIGGVFIGIVFYFTFILLEKHFIKKGL